MAMIDGQTLSESLTPLRGLEHLTPLSDVRAMQAFHIRVATNADQVRIKALMALSIRHLQEPFLDARQIEASFDIMGLDSQLVEDGTYYVVEESNVLIGCGGWSRRATLYGGSHSAGRDDALLNPAVDAARIRAMYTHPSHARRGVGRLVLETCERAARHEGYARTELVATLAGEPFYQACGYQSIEAIQAATRSGVSIPGRRMGKDL